LPCARRQINIALVRFDIGRKTVGNINTKPPDTVTQLYPLPAAERALKGLYLDHHLHRYSAISGRAYVYANFVASIDGRIAIPHPSRPGMMVPQDVANERDWRLFQELAAQADLIISSGRYLRDWADGRAQEILQVDDPRFADLRAWRQDQGMPPQPDLAIISGSLEFPIPDVLTAGGRKVVVFTSANPDPARVAEIEAKAGQVFVVGEEGVDGGKMVEKMAGLGYHTVYSAAGPKILHLLITGGVLNRLYLTHANRLLGGEPFSSIVEGPLLDPAVALQINTVYLDQYALNGQGQLFLSYDLV
jgi:riboflavin biosynthesis pyrimidine reductase